MASNPMQRQKKISFLLGFLTMLIFASLIIGFLGYTLFTMKAEEKAKVNAMKEVYILSTDVESGGKIDASVYKSQKVVAELVPSNRFTADNLLDEEGNIREDLVSKIDLKKGSVLTTDMVSISTEKSSDDLRKQEYNVVSLPIEVETGDYVDVRIRFASGADYIVLSKKAITIPEVGGIPSADTFTLNLTEAETLLMSSAIVETFSAKGTEMYVNTFTDPGLQKEATPTYQPSDGVMRLIGNNPNIVTEAKNALYTRYVEEERKRIDKEVGEDSEESKENVDAGIKEHITRQKQYRQEYIDALGGAV